MAYKSTLEFSSPLPKNNSWNTTEGHEKFMTLVRKAMEEAVPGGRLSSLVSWDKEIEQQLLKTHIPPFATLDPIPFAVQESALVLADRYVTRWRMRSRLENMRTRTAVALQPRGIWDEKSENSELAHTPQKNSSYKKYLERFQ